MNSAPAYNPGDPQRPLVDCQPLWVEPEDFFEEHARDDLGDPEDELEVETIEHAIRSLRGSGLLRYRNDDRVVEPTHAALCAAALLLAP